MTEWRMPGMPRVPGLSEMLALMQAQAELLSQLPTMMAELNRAAGGLSDALGATRLAAGSAERATARVEQILEEIEAPILALRPGLERVAKVLDDPVIDRIPQTLEAIESIVLPISRSVARARSRVESMKARGRVLAQRAAAAKDARQARL